MLTFKQILICLSVAGVMFCAVSVSQGSIVSTRDQYSQASHSPFDGLISSDENCGSQSRMSPVKPTQSNDQDQKSPSNLRSDSMSTLPSSGGGLSSASSASCIVSPFAEVCCQPDVSGWLYYTEYLRFPIPPIKTLLKVPIAL